jgi:hypothetical protein
MTVNLEYLSTLRQEIADLKMMNERGPGKSHRNSMDQSAFDTRSTRLLEIKQELSKLMSKPHNPVWW